MGQSPFPVPAPVVEALRLHAHEKDYLPVKGLPAIREAVAGFHKQKDLVEANSDCVLVGPGSKELMFLLQLVFYGEIIVPTPCWVSYVPQAQMLGKRISLLHTCFEDKWHISANLVHTPVSSYAPLLRPGLRQEHKYHGKDLQAADVHTKCSQSLSCFGHCIKIHGHHPKARADDPQTACRCGDG